MQCDPPLAQVAGTSVPRVRSQPVPPLAGRAGRSRLPATVRAGFTLIELMAAIAILMMIVSMIAVIFTESDRAYTLGTDRAEGNMSARAALGLLAHDLQYAVADDVFTFTLRPDRKNIATYGVANSELCFVSLQHDSADGTRTAREIYYYVDGPDTDGNFNLFRGYVGAALTDNPNNHCYWKRDWYENNRPSGEARGVIAENVAAFQVYPANPDDPDYPPDPSMTYLSDDDPNDTNRFNRLPFYVDIYLEILPEQAANQASDMAEKNVPELNDFVERKAHRYTTRVFFLNRHGYAKR